MQRLPRGAGVSADSAPSFIALRRGVEGNAPQNGTPCSRHQSSIRAAISGSTSARFTQTAVGTRADEAVRTKPSQVRKAETEAPSR